MYFNLFTVVCSIMLAYLPDSKVNVLVITISIRLHTSDPFSVATECLHTISITMKNNSTDTKLGYYQVINFLLSQHLSNRNQIIMPLIIIDIFLEERATCFSKCVQ